MPNEYLLLQIDPRGIATIAMNRPDLHNAFDDTMIAGLSATLEELRANPDVRAVVLAARGKSFSAGADLNYMKRVAGYSRDENVADALALGRMLLALRTHPVPTIALIQGATFGGGVGLVAACDVAVAVKYALFGLTEAKLGLIPAMISPFVIDAIGIHQARRYFQTAERFDAEVAQRIGLVHEVVATDTALDAHRDHVIDQILATGPEAARHVKRLVADVGRFSVDDALLQDLAVRIAERRASEEGIEGISSFLERRQPNWSADG